MMPVAREPQHDQAEQQHRRRGAAFDGSSRPALRLLEAELALGRLEGLLDRPAHRVPGQHLRGRRVMHRRVERLRRAAAAQRLDRDDPKRTLRRGVDPRLALGHATMIAAAVQVERQACSPLLEPFQRRGQTWSAPPWATIRTGLPRWRRLVQPGLEVQPAGQVAVVGQTAQDALAAIGRISDDVKTPLIPGAAEGIEHLDRQLRPRAVEPAAPGDRLFADVQPKEDRQAEAVIRAERQPHDHAQDHPTVAPVNQRDLARGQQRIVVHADAVNLQAAFTSQRVIQRQQHRPVAQPGFNQAEHRQTQVVERPTGRGEQTMEGRVMLGPILPIAGKPGAPQRRPEQLYADRAYDSNRHRLLLGIHGIEPVIARRNTPHGSGLGRFHWVVERTISWLHRFRRLRVRYERRDDIHECYMRLGCGLICWKMLNHGFC